MTDNTYLLTNVLKEAQERIHAQEQARQHDQKFWADEIYKLKQRLEKLENMIPDAFMDFEKQLISIKDCVLSIMQQYSIPTLSQEPDLLAICVAERKKPKFVKGDRIAVYYWKGRRIGTISSITETGMIYFIEDGFYSAHEDCPFHPKQCRRLRKKK